MVSLQCLGKVQSNLARASGPQPGCYRLPGSLSVSLNPQMCHCVCRIILSTNLYVLNFIAPIYVNILELLQIEKCLQFKRQLVLLVNRLGKNDLIWTDLVT